MNNRLKTANNKSFKNEKIILGIILAVAVILYNFIWLNKTFTLSEGWAFYYNNLIAGGKVPYRDFYYYLPPLNLFIDFIIWKISTGYFFVYRCIRLLERVLIVELMYFMVSKKVHPFIASIGSFLAAILASANVYDLVGDYNQTVQLLVVMLCILVSKYSECFDDVKRRCKWMFLIGICGGCMFLSKQTIVFASAASFALFVLIMLIAKKEKNIFKMTFSVAFGVAVPLGICGIYFVATHSLTEFITQVFADTSSKGSALGIIFGSQGDIIKNCLVFLILIVAITILYSVAKAKSSAFDISKNSKYIDTGCIILTCIIFTYGFSGSIASALDVAKKSIVLIFFIVVAALIMFAKLDTIWGKAIVIVSLIATAGIMFLNVKDYTSYLYYYSGLFSMLTTILTYVYLFLIVWLIQHIVKHFIFKTPLATDSMIFALGGIASAWSTSMATGVGGVSTICAFLAIPAVVYIIFKNKKITDQIYVKALIIITVLTFSICLSQKLTCAYNWWGDTEASYSEKTQTSENRALKGFKFSKNEIKRVDDLTNLIAENTDESSTIYGFPYIKIYNVLLDNYNMDTFVPVPFYDVCSDNFAAKDAKLLKKNEPDIVVWQDIPGCMETHENLFRDNEPLGQRKIQKWFSQVSKTDYELIGQVDDIFVYKLKKDGKSSKTYIELKNKQNKTLKKSDLRTKENTLKGSGKENDPYLISSQDDLILFAKLVNQGMSFFDKYIEQTADIDLKNIDSWTPIGKYDKGKYFSGTYNGNGYKISNLTIPYNDGISAKEDDDNDYDEIDKSKCYVGLFGSLSGNVKNINLVNCNISGRYVGSIACYTSGNAKIYNCSVSGVLNAKKRAGGIVDNNNGLISNSVSYCKLEAVKIGGVSGYYNGTIENSFSIYGDKVSKIDGQPIDSKALNRLNNGISDVKKKNKVELNTWNYDGKTLSVKTKSSATNKK